MTIRNLEYALRPSSIAVIGASDDGGSVGEKLTENILGGGFAGPVYLVNPKRRRIAGQDGFQSIDELPEAPDLAVIATPPDTVPGLIAALGKKGTRAAVVITAGLGLELRQRMLDAARPTCLRIIGPNCLGLWVPALGVNANFGMAKPKPGKLAFLSQSGALVGGVLDWAESRGIGFSYVVSMGDMADVDAGDLLDFLAADISTSAILLYLETIPSARKFMSASRSAARAKPVVVIKSGRSEASARAAATHTGALAGSDAAVVSAFRRASLAGSDAAVVSAFRRAGLMRVEERELTAEDIRFRFLAPRKEFSHKTNARFTQIDYGRAMAFVAFREDQSELLGVARLAADPDYVSAEYAVIVRSDLKGAGLGWTLMQHLIRYAESEGLRDSLVLPPMVLALHRVALKSVMLETLPAAAPQHDDCCYSERDGR